MLTAWEKTCLCYVCAVHCLVLKKRSNYSVMIALTWCVQLCESYSCTKLFCLLDQVPEDWFWDYCIFQTHLFCRSFVLLLILEDAFHFHCHISHSLHVCVRTPRHAMTEVKQKLMALRAKSVSRGCFKVWCCCSVHSSPVSRYVKNVGCASLLSGQRVFTHLTWLSSMTTWPLLGEKQFIS